MVVQMITISEAITTIKKAENDADKLIEDSKLKSSEMIDEAKAKSMEMMETAKKEAQSQSETIISEAETNAKKEAVHISNRAQTGVQNIKTQSAGKVAEAANIIVKSVL